MNKRIFPVIIISILWAFIFNISKKITSFTDDIVSVVMLKTLIIGTVGLIGTLLFRTKNDKVFENIKNLDNRIWYLAIFSILLEIMSSYFYFNSLQDNQLSWVIPLIEAGIILLSVLLSLLFFKEELNIYRFSGIILIIGGIFLVYNN